MRDSRLSVPSQVQLLERKVFLLLHERDHDLQRVIYDFRHDGPRLLKDMPLTQSCPSCAEPYPVLPDTSMMSTPRTKMQKNRAAALRHLPDCQGLCCMLEFFEYILASLEKSTRLPRMLIDAAKCFDLQRHLCQDCSSRPLQKPICVLMELIDFAC